jgi:hypothetical protein
MAKAISQSDTMWVKKGDKLPDGSIAKRGVLWDTKNKKRVTGAVKLVEGTKRGKAGETLSVKAGRYTKSNAGAGKKAGSNGGGKKPPTLAASSGYQAGSPRSTYKPTSAGKIDLSGKRAASSRRRETPMAAPKPKPQTTIAASLIRSSVQRAMDFANANKAGKNSETLAYRAAKALAAQAAENLSVLDKNKKK